MALIHQATLNPPKLDLLKSWLPTRPWFDGGTDVTQLGAYRFDDPAGEVGLEAFLLEAGDGSVLHVPLTYRGAPVTGAEEFLVGVSEHSALGTRWVYDGCGDPVWAVALATAILKGGPQAEELVQVGDDLVPREPTVNVRGTGSGGGDTQVAAIDEVHCHDEGLTTVVQTRPLDLIVIRVLGTEAPTAQTLIGTWADGGPAVLAGVRSV